MSDLKTILLVDDDDDLRNAGEITLQAKGYNVVTACNSIEAEKTAAEIKPDLILMDIMMEEVDAGLVFAEKFGTTYKILLLSSIADSSSAVFDAHKLPIQGILQKPMGGLDLTSHIERAISE